MRGCDDRDENSPPNDVEADDEGCHADNGSPLLGTRDGRGTPSAHPARKQQLATRQTPSGNDPERHQTNVRPDATLSHLVGKDNHVVRA